MFSVVIPLYNKEKQIKQTLHSVLNQTFGDFEIVIVNDGSKDGSVEAVQSINDSRIRLINQENGGVSAARNRGVREAKNKWVAFLDADDLWREDKLEKVSKVIDNNPNVPWVLSGYQSIKGSKRYNYVYNYSGILADGIDDLNNGLSIQTSTVVVPKEYFIQDDRLFFKEGINHSEDREVWYRLLFRYPNPFYIKEPLTDYIIDVTGMSLNTNNLMNFSFLELKDRLSDDLYMLEDHRRLKFLKFIDAFNRKVLWVKWVSTGWKSQYKSYLSEYDVILMKKMSFLPRQIRSLFKKILI